MYLQIFFFKVLTNLSATTDFSSLCVESIFMSLSCNHDFIDFMHHSLPLSLNMGRMDEEPAVSEQLTSRSDFKKWS